MGATKDWLSEAAERAAAIIRKASTMGTPERAEERGAASRQLEAAVLLLPRLAEALKPFAAHAESFGTCTVDEAPVADGFDFRNERPVKIVVGDCRAARALLAEVERVKGGA